MAIKVEQIDFIEKAKRLSKLIVENENILSDLESNNLKDSKIYSEMYNSLLTLIKEEKILYNSLTYTHDDIVDIIKQLNNERDLLSFTSQLNILMQNNYPDVIIIRIINKLKTLDLSLNQKEINNFGNLVTIYANQNKISSNSKLGIYIIDEEIKKDIINTILKLTNEEIQKNPNQEYQSYFIKMKYHLAMIYGFVEEKLINDNFNIDNSLYWLSSSYAYYYNIDNTLFEAYKAQIINNLGQYTTAYFNDLDDTDLKIKKKLNQAQFQKILLQTVIIFSPSILTSQIKKLTIETIELKKRRNICYEGEKMIVEVIDNINNIQNVATNISAKIRKKES